MRINTNVGSLNAQTNSQITSRNLTTNLERLSSGLRINKAADDASGMAIADSLRSQANSLGQAVKNANDAIGIIQTADKAMDEQIKILDTIKVKATQAAQDGQTTETRKALQADIVRLMEELDNIAGTTSFNGQQLLSGQFINKEFQIGAYSNQTIKATIGATSSDKIGSVRYETTANIPVSGASSSSLQVVQLKFLQVDGKNDITLEQIKISTSAGTGLGALAEVINKNSDRIGGVRAAWNVQGTGATAIVSGNVQGLQINGVNIGSISGVRMNDSDGRLINAINSVKDRTGVEAFVDNEGRLNMKSTDGRAISIQATSGSTVLGKGSFDFISSTPATHAIIGRLTLTRLDSRDILVSGNANFNAIGIVSDAATFGNSAKAAQTVVNLRDLRGDFNANVASAAGSNYNNAMGTTNKSGLGAGVTTLRGAMMVMDMAESAIKLLDKIRSDLGSVQNQLVVTVNNVNVTQVNVKSAESQIRDVDFASESADFSKNNILAQSGSYALSQANTVQQNVLKLLQ